MPAKIAPESPRDESPQPLEQGTREPSLPQQLLKDLPGVERLTAYIFKKLHPPEPEEQSDAKHHLLTTPKRVLILVVAVITCLGAGGAGALSAYVTIVMNIVVAVQVSSDSSVEYYVITIAYSILWSILEITVAYVFACYGVTRTVRIFGINLWPKEKEKALVAGALSRAAFELGFPEGRQMGVDPSKTQSKLLMLIFAVIFMAKRGIIKFILKFIVKKMGPRLTVKAVEEADDLIQIIVNVVINFLTTWIAMNEVRFCCLGPSAVEEYLKTLVDSHPSKGDMEERTKLAAMRVVGVTVCNKECMHPNLRYALSAMAKEWVGPDLEDDNDEAGFIKRNASSVGILDSAEEQPGIITRFLAKFQRTPKPPPKESELGYQERLDHKMKPLNLDDREALLTTFKDKGTTEDDRNFLLGIAVFASCLDGRASYKQLLFLQDLGSLCDPKLLPSLRKHNWLRRRFIKGIYIQPGEFKGVMGGGGGCDMLVFPWQGEFYMLLQAAVIRRCNYFYRVTPNTPDSPNS